jgi:hypothetical protein
MSSVRKAYYAEALSETSGSGVYGAIIYDSIDYTNEDYWAFSSVQVANTSSSAFSHSYIEQADDLGGVGDPNDFFPVVQIPSFNYYKMQQATTDYHTFPQMADIELEQSGSLDPYVLYQFMFD